MIEMAALSILSFPSLMEFNEIEQCLVRNALQVACPWGTLISNDVEVPVSIKFFETNHYETKQ